MSVACLERLIHEIADELPQGVHVGIADPSDPPDGLYPIESAALARARPVRCGEFAAGRRAARAAMRKAGRDDTPIPVQEDRSPVWPPGLTGSISHTRTAALAVVSPRPDLLLGVDIEEDSPLPEDLIGEIAARDELFLAEERAIAARRAFSAKEAAYKAQFPATRTVFGFDGLHLAEHGTGAAMACFTADVPPWRKGAGLRIRQWAGHGMVISICTGHPPGTVLRD